MIRISVLIALLLGLTPYLSYFSYFLPGTNYDDYTNYANTIDDVEMTMTLPVRVFDSKKTVAGLSRNHFQLTVNGSHRELTGFKEYNVNLGKRPEFLGRHFILSFHVLEYGKELQDAVGKFVTDIFTPRDSLTLMSPLKVYSIKGSANKEAIIDNIRLWMETDCSAYRKSFNGIQKELEHALKQVKQVAGRSGRVDDNYLVQSYKHIGMFLNSFPRGFKTFRDTFLLPDVTRYKGVIQLLGMKEGERWWIGFEQGELFEIIGSIREALVHIEDYMNLSSLARTAFAANVNDLEKLLRLPDNVPVRSFSEMFQRGRTRFNLVVLSKVKKNSSARTGLLNGVVSVFAPITRDTGGIALPATELDKAMEQLISHHDHFYTLSYQADKENKDHAIHLTVSDKAGGTFKAAYLPLLDKEFISTFLDYYYMVERIKIDRVTVNGEKLSFSVHSFRSADSEQSEPFGLVKIRILLLNKEGKQMFRTEKTLRSQNRQINISLPLPIPNKQKYQISITACDLIANRLVRTVREFKQ